MREIAEIVKQMRVYLMGWDCDCDICKGKNTYYTDALEALLTARTQAYREALELAVNRLEHSKPTQDLSQSEFDWHNLAIMIAEAVLKEAK